MKTIMNMGMGKHKAVRCPRCRNKTAGKLFAVGSNNVCETCRPACSGIAITQGFKIRRVR